MTPNWTGWKVPMGKYRGVCTMGSSLIRRAGSRRRASPSRYRLITSEGLFDIGQHWLSLRARSVLARRSVDRTADHYRKKVAEYEREAESATDETMRAYLCMMRDQWLIVAEAFESTDKNESTTEETLSNLVHSRAAFQSRNCRRRHQASNR